MSLGLFALEAFESHLQSRNEPYDHGLIFGNIVRKGKLEPKVQRDISAIKVFSTSPTPPPTPLPHP